MWVGSIGLMMLAAVTAQSSTSPPERAQASAREVPSHPGEVAFVDEGERGFVYRRFPSGQRLYTNDRDRPGRSSCKDGCASAWPPVYAPADAVAMGDWSPITRSDGRRQWALKGKPVYTRFHDHPDRPRGDGIKGRWHLVPYTIAQRNPNP